MAKTIKAGAPVGFIGLGIMGSAMARNLMKAGFKVHVHNRSRAKAEALAREGAAACATPAEVAQASVAIVLCLPDTPDVERVLFGETGVVRDARPGTVVIDCSTISPTATVEFARRLAAHGLHLVDSPVSGGPKGAQDATLSCMIGGDAQIVERCMPVLRAMGKTFTHIGGSGAGQACKACNQLVIVGTLMVVAEAFALTKKMEIDPYKVRDALLGGSAQSFVLQNHGKRLLDGALAPGFRASLMWKDIKLALNAGRETGAFMPVTALGAQMFAALCNSQRGELDNAALGLMFEELSGLRR